MGKGGVRRGGAAKWGNPSNFASIGTLAFEVRAHRDKPGPGTYNTTLHSRIAGGRMSRTRAKTELDWHIHMKKNIPGPNAYGNPQAGLAAPGGGRFSSASVPSYIDLEQKRASLIPGPGEYNTAPKASGGQTWGKSSPPTAMDMLIRRANDSPAPWDTSRLKQQDVPGGKWSKTQSKSELDWIIHRAAKLPAPGAYGNPDQAVIRGGRIGRSAPVGYIDHLQARAKKLPGPGQYDVDSAYENSTFCNKFKLEEEIRSRRATTSIGCSRSGGDDTFLDSSESPHLDVSLSPEHKEVFMSHLMDRYAAISQATSSPGSRQGLYNSRKVSTRHVLGDFDDLEANSLVKRPETVLSMAPPIGDAKRAAFLRRNLPKLYS